MAAKPKSDFFSLVAKRSAEIIGGEHLKRALAARKKLRVKFGIDPTAPHVHLGHVVPIRVLREFQKAGHRAVLIIGDFTAAIGDPSGQASGRRQLTAREVKENERTYWKQIATILDVKKTEVRHNSEWYGRMPLKEFLAILTQFSLKSAWEREDFQRRLKAGKQVRLHEAMYPVLQGYDSIAVRADVEIGSIDQRLNLLAGRELQGRIGLTPQDIIITPYLVGVDGEQKMSKSVGNTIHIDDSPRELFGKVMAIPDKRIMHYAELAAWLPPKRIKELNGLLSGSENPRNVKLDVAEAVVTLYHGVRVAAGARREFIDVFSGRKKPSSLSATRLKKKTYQPTALLIELKAASSKSEARRLVSGGALRVDDAVITLHDSGVSIKRGSIIQIGKKKFYRVG